jgi:hypothetical protein
MAAFRFKVTHPNKQPFEQQSGPHASAVEAMFHMKKMHPEGTVIEPIKPSDPVAQSSASDKQK